MLIGLKGGGFVTFKALEAIGKVGDDVKGKTKKQVEKMLAGTGEKVFATYKEADEYLSSDVFKKKWKAPDQTAMNTYTGSGYMTLNPALKNQALQGTAIDPATQKKIKALDKALNKIPGYTGEVHRGISVGNTYQFLQGYKEGAKVTFPAYTSTSTDNAFGGNVKYHITGSGKNGKAVFGLSNYPHEHEVLYKKNTSFTVKKVEPKTSGYMPDGKTKKIVGAEVWLEEI